MTTPSNAELADIVDCAVGTMTCPRSNAEWDRVDIDKLRLAASRLREAEARIFDLETALGGMLTVEPQDRGHVHTIRWTTEARAALEIADDMPVGLWFSRHKRRPVKKGVEDGA
jgi:hypothetical protein